ncbi:polymorphic toxin-type HINT domain-containing protein, partial [Frigidibacter sp. SD6-1]|uniref:polymorphic toxin-type HINT domain-containing protein n=1 Tax=Frigidibacter sp. SD6-1 TaxID=3032581 RepID=UPI0024DF5904
RQATDLVWLGLEASGQSSRLGVTAEHPLYVEGRGWVQAGELALGDRIVDADGGVITVVSRELDDRPTLVHNLEVAGAHTYFAGELEAWGHNARSRTSGNSSAADYGKSMHDNYRCDLERLRLPSGKVVDGWDPNNQIVYELKPDTPSQRRRGKRQVAAYVCELQAIYGNGVQGILEFYRPFKG